jgi:hypothetical protein
MIDEVPFNVFFVTVLTVKLSLVEELEIILLRRLSTELGNSFEVDDGCCIDENGVCTLCCTIVSIEVDNLLFVIIVDSKCVVLSFCASPLTI